MIILAHLSKKECEIVCSLSKFSYLCIGVWIYFSAVGIITLLSSIYHSPIKICAKQFYRARLSLEMQASEIYCKRHRCWHLGVKSTQGFMFMKIKGRPKVMWEEY